MQKLFVAVIVTVLSLSLTARGDSITVGEVVKIDGPAGLIIVKHGAIPELGLTAPTSIDGFHVNGDVMQGMAFNALRAGDRINFHAERIDGELTITDAEKK